jgi:hypothetical protein
MFMLNVGLLAPQIHKNKQLMFIIYAEVRDHSIGE